MHCVGKKEIMDRCFPYRSRFIIHKTCLQGRFQPVSIRGNKTSDMEKKPYRLFLCCYIYREGLLANGAIGEEKRKKENKKSPIRTFFILHRETILEAPPRFELGIKVLQTFALPLGYSADWSGLRGSNSLPPPWQGGALPDELNPQWRSGWDSNPRPLP